MSQETSEWLNTQTRIGFTDRRGKAWHFSADYQTDGGNHFPGAVPLESVQELFDWEPVVVPLCYPKTETVMGGPQDGAKVTTYRESTRGKIVVVRSDTWEDLGDFSEGYQVHGYKKWLLDNVATLLDGDLSIGSAGLLKRGAQAWVQVEMPENIEGPAGVVFRPWLMATTSLDGTIATTYKRGFTDVVCDNTRSLFLKEAGEVYKRKHTRNSAGEMKYIEAREALNIVYKMADDISAEIKKLTDQKVTNAQWDAFVSTYFAPETGSKVAETKAKNKQYELNDLWYHSEMVTPWKGTAWGVIQAVNTWTHHDQQIRITKSGAQSRAERNYSLAVRGEFDAIDAGTWGTLSKILATV